MGFEIIESFSEWKDVELFTLTVPFSEKFSNIKDFFVTEDEAKVYFYAGNVIKKDSTATSPVNTVKNFFRMSLAEDISPSEVLFKVNNDICNTNKANNGVNVFLSCLNLQTGELEYSNTGDNLFFVIRKSGYVENLEGSLDKLLGAKADTLYTNNKNRLENGDKVIILTNHYIKKSEKTELFFSGEVLKAFLEKQGSVPLDDLSGLLVNEIKKLNESSRIKEDITAVLVEYERGGRLNLILDNDLSEIARLSEAVDGYVLSKGLDFKLAININLVLEEIVTNIISYGYKDVVGDKKIYINFKLKDKYIELVVRDNAKAFNPLDLPDPKIDQSVEERQVGGLGIYLVRQMMDSVSYRREKGSNVLVLRKATEINT